MCLLSTHIDPEWQCLHKIIHSKCSVTSKEDIKHKKKEAAEEWANAALSCNQYGCLSR